MNLKTAVPALTATVEVVLYPIGNVEDSRIAGMRQKPSRKKKDINRRYKHSSQVTRRYRASDQRSSLPPLSSPFPSLQLTGGDGCNSVLQRNSDFTIDVFFPSPSSSLFLHTSVKYE